MQMEVGQGIPCINYRATTKSCVKTVLDRWGCA